MLIDKTLVVRETKAGDQLLDSREDGTTMVRRFVEVSEEEFLVELRDKIKRCADLLDRAVQADADSGERHCADGALYWLQEPLDTYLAKNGFAAMNC